MTDRNKHLSNLGTGRSKEMQKRLADVPMDDELPIEDKPPVDDELPPEDKPPVDDELPPEDKPPVDDELPPEDPKDDQDPEIESDSSSSDSSSDSDSDSDSEYECEVCKKKFSGYIPLKQHEKGRKHAQAVLRKKKEQKLKGKTEDDDHGAELLIPEPYAICKVCDKQFAGPENYHAHLVSKQHKQKVLEASILKEVREQGGINIDKLRELSIGKKKAEVNEAKLSTLKALNDDEESMDEFECKDCEMTFTGLMPFTQHLVSKSHAKRVEKQQMLQKVFPGTSRQGDLSTISLEDDILVCKLCSTSFSGPESALMHLKSKKHSKNLDKYFRKLERKKEKEETSSRKENKVKEYNEVVEMLKEKHQATCEASKEGEPSKISVVDTGIQSTSSADNSNVLEDYKKYKEYKKLMNSIQQDDDGIL